MTASNRIPFVASTQGGIMLAELVSKTRECVELAGRLRQVMLSITGGDTPANLEDGVANGGEFFKVGSGSGSAFNTIAGSVIGKFLNDGGAGIDPGWLVRLDQGG